MLLTLSARAGAITLFTLSTALKTPENQKGKTLKIKKKKSKVDKGRFLVYFVINVL